MTLDITIRDRVIRMEVELEQVKKDVKAVKDSVAEVDAKVDEIKEILTQAKGVQNVFKAMIWLSGTSLFVWVATYYKAFIALFSGAH